jgi:shikimate kinase
MSSKHLLLTGYRGCGKSAVGDRLARRLNRHLIDIDVEIESNAGKSIAELFSEVGEQGFRELESYLIVRQRSLEHPSIISLGGGSVLRQENRDCIRDLGHTVWLQATPETIFERISNDKLTQARRPKLSKLGDMDEIRSILAKRIEWYKEVSDFAVATDGLSMDKVTELILDWYQHIH